MKKILAALLCAGIIAVLASGCMGGQTANPADIATGDEASSMNAKDYDDTLEGLGNYFAAYGYLNPKDTANLTKMDASLVGAEKGNKYAKYTDGKATQATIELYEFNTDKLSDTAKEIIDSVQKNGTFTILNLPEVKACMSDSGKFMMVYTDKSINDEKPDEESDAYKAREEITEKFKAFHS